MNNTPATPARAAAGWETIWTLTLRTAPDGLASNTGETWTWRRAIFDEA